MSSSVNLAMVVHARVTTSASVGKCRLFGGLLVFDEVLVGMLVFDGDFVFGDDLVFGDACFFLFLVVFAFAFGQVLAVMGGIDWLFLC